MGDAEIHVAVSDMDTDSHVLYRGPSGSYSTSNVLELYGIVQPVSTTILKIAQSSN